MTDKLEVTSSLMNWANIFMRYSLEDFNRYARSAGLSFGQMTVIFHLHYSGPCEVSHFGELLQITTAGASQMIDRLVKLGMVTRSESSTDRRIRRVQLTDNGKRIVEESIAARQAWVGRLVENLSEDEQQLIHRAMHVLSSTANERADEIVGARF